MREIQVSGKQLVFLFMTSVVVAVIIFLLGVSVGRGVHGAAIPAGTDALVMPAPTTLPPAPPSGAPKPGELSYAGRLGGSPTAGPGSPATPPVTPPGSGRGAADAPPQTSPAPSVAAPPSSASRTSPPARADASKGAAGSGSASSAHPTSAVQAKSPQSDKLSPSEKPAATTPPAPESGGWVLQFNAFRSRANADGQVAELAAKGYQASVVQSTTLFVVRMGPFAQRADADAMLARLKKDGYSPLVKR